MRKRLTIAAVGIAICLMLSVSGVACAYFNGTATATVSGRTGYVSIRTWNVNISETFQPGDTQFVWLKVKNNGNCPIQITKAEILGLRSWLGAYFKVKPLRQTFQPGQTLAFRLYVYMDPSRTGPQDTPILFQIRFYAQNVATKW